MVEFVPVRYLLFISSELLVIAAIYNCMCAVEVLLGKINVDIESEMKIGYMSGVTALWCASAHGHLNLVKMLIHHGADVNHCTTNGSSPLRAACSAGHFDI
ncbi:unnamed protein product, partial [Didymodactylos carnosus]